MSSTKEDDKKMADMYASSGGEPEIVATAVPAGVAPPGGSGAGEAPIPPGHSRFYCNKCRTPYDLPDKATSWRCQNCMEFNSTTPGECPWCTIL